MLDTFQKQPDELKAYNDIDFTKSILPTRISCELFVKHIRHYKAYENHNVSEKHDLKMVKGIS